MAADAEGLSDCHLSQPLVARSVATMPNPGTKLGRAGRGSMDELQTWSSWV
jgi:hypothetical protein